MERYPSVAGRRGFLVATSAAASFLLIAGLLQIVASLVSWVFFSTQQSGLYDVQVASRLALYVVSLIPFALGVLLSLWLLAPLAKVLRLPQVILRSLLALVAGAFAQFLALLVMGLLGRWSDSDARVFGVFEAVLRTAERGLDYTVFSGLYTAVNQAVSFLPLIVLVGVLAWLWLQNHPQTRTTAGLTDEV